MKSKSDGPSSSLALLFRLIEDNDWRRLDSTFLADPAGATAYRRLAAHVAKSQKSSSGMTIMHACVRYDPPSTLVKRMIELCPDEPSSLDCLGRTPLHVAAGTGASSSVIRALVNACPEACMIRDDDGRVPLHMACDSSSEIFADEHYQRGPPSYRTVAVLLSMSLESSVMEDEDGMSPIEYALCSEAGLKTVRLIQSAAQEVMLRRRDEERATKAKLRRRDDKRVNGTKGEKPPADRGVEAAAKMFTARKGLLTAASA